MGKAGIMALMGMNHLTWKRYLETPFRKRGMTLKQAYLLRRLAEQGALQPAQIANMLFCDRPTATVIVRNLEKKKLVSRRREESDRRRWSIRLTPKGRRQRKLLERVRPVGSRFDPVACLDESEQAELERLLRKVREHLRHIEGEQDNESDTGDD